MANGGEGAGLEGAQQNRTDRYAATAVTMTPRRIWPWMCAPAVPAGNQIQALRQEILDLRRGAEEREEELAARLAKQTRRRR